MTGFPCGQCGTTVSSYPCHACSYDRPASLPQQVNLKSIPKAGLLATTGLVPVTHACQLIVE